VSIDRCSRCGDLVDTDDEPEAYVQIADMRKREEWICLCRRHREEREDERQDRIADAVRQMPRDWTPTPEQQAFIDASESEADAP
jgi:hypothetical protein